MLRLSPGNSPFFLAHTVWYCRGAAAAAAQLAGLQEFQAASVIKVNPDTPQKQARAYCLQEAPVPNCCRLLCQPGSAPHFGAANLLLQRRSNCAPHPHPPARPTQLAGALRGA